jgi:ABC-type antimicrobial peptide transport system permease subunit
MLGIIIGVASVIDMVAIGKGAQSRIEEQISSMGTNMVMVWPGGATTADVTWEQEASHSYPSMTRKAKKE